MATTKTVQATVKNRTDTATNWTQKNPVLAEGEIIVVQTSAGETRLKIGDGAKTFTQLPYTDEQIYNNVVTSVNGQTGDVTLNVPGGVGSMKKLTFTGAVTGEYDGTTDVSIDIPSNAYIIQLDTNDILVNDFDELINAIKSQKIIIISDTNGYRVATNADVVDSTQVQLDMYSFNLTIYVSIVRDTKKATFQYGYGLNMEYKAGSFSPKSGVVYFDEATGLCSTKDSVSPIASTSTAGTIKVGNGLSIADDGTLSVTTATYYTGASDPVNTLGLDGDLYLKMEE